MGPQPTRVVHEAWDIYVSRTERGPLFVSFDEQAAREDLTGTMRHCARVAVRIHHPNPNGGPVPPESDRLIVLEDALCEALAAAGVECRLVARLTHQGVREWVFQLESREDFLAVVEDWKAQCPDYHPVKVLEHEGWEFFDACIRPDAATWRWMADQRTVERLVEAGSDPTRVHALEFVFHGSRDGLEAVARALRERGYGDGPSGEEGALVMIKHLPLELDAISDESDANEELANTHGVDFDGWGAAVVR
jgi:regulator of RNase E activity RraB